MSYTNKKFEELNVIDDFLMNAVATDETVGIPFCRAVLSVLLQRKIGKIRVMAQRAIPALTPTMRGIRLDVEVEEYGEETDISLPSMNMYDIEPNLRKNLNLPKHNRFYQAKIDSRRLKSGEKDFSRLPNLYVISITDFDPFGYDHMMYTIKNHCMELSDMVYEDGLQFIYFYTKGSKGGNEEIKAMLNYIQNSTEKNVTNSVIREIHKYVEEVRIQPEVKEEYMTLEDIIYYEREEERLATQQEEKVQAVFDLLEDYGELPDKLQQRLKEETDFDILKAWLKFAAKVQSISEFEQGMDEVKELAISRKTVKQRKD